MPLSDRPLIFFQSRSFFGIVNQRTPKTRAACIDEDCRSEQPQSCCARSSSAEGEANCRGSPRFCRRKSWSINQSSLSNDADDLLPRLAPRPPGQRRRSRDRNHGPLLPSSRRCRHQAEKHLHRRPVAEVPARRALVLDNDRHRGAGRRRVTNVTRSVFFLFYMFFVFLSLAHLPLNTHTQTHRREPSRSDLVSW